MANIKEIINEKTTIATIDQYYEKKFKQRRRLGLSQVGHKCHRYLWYKHHGYDEPVPDGRVLRLFELGNVLEDQVASDLVNAGFEITDRQAPVEITCDGVTLNGSCDGIIHGLIEAPKTPHLWECKTMGSKGFNKLLKYGYEAYNPQYKAQIHCYMLGLNLTRAFTIVYNKDTSKLYQERIRLNKDWAVDMLQDVFRSISRPTPPPRLCTDPEFFEAKWCVFNHECWRDAV